MAEPVDLYALAAAVREAGGRALVVGGAARDRLTGRPAHDIDVEVYGLDSLRVREILSRFGPVNAVGDAFTVYKVGGIDVSLPRRESKTGRGHRGFEVIGDPLLSIDEAARRRDFTINAIAWDPLRDEYIDPYGGRADLEHHILRVVDPDTFADDSLRVLRAIQFAARFELTLDPRTAELCRQIDLGDLPAERIWGEIEKLLVLAARPSGGFEVARELSVITRLFPEMAALIGCEQEPDWHPEGDVWTHTLLVIDEARTRIADLDHPRKVTIMLGAVCHDFGKPATTAWIDGRIRSHNHEDAGVAPTTTFLDRLNIQTLGGYEVRKQVLGLVAHHLKPGMWFRAKEAVKDSAFRRLAQKVDLDLLARLAKSDCMGRSGQFDCTAMDWFVERARALGVQHRPPAPLLRGRDVLALGLAPGPQVGAILRRVYERQLDGEIASHEQAVEIAAEEIRQQR
jgi:tRNA nucleotidyltransferase (CCA-adding enzyme)